MAAEPLSAAPAARTDMPRPALGTRLRQRIVIALKPRGKLAFVHQLPPAARVVDLGCGNNSPREFKSLRADLHYAGLDIGEYNQDRPTEFADAYVITTPAGFARSAGELARQAQAVVSAHNLEHCDEPDAVLRNVLDALPAGAQVYLAFPCEASVGFPHRRGTLNFHDDPTHRVVPRWDDVLAALQRHGFELLYTRQRYRPLLLAVAGLLLEPLAALTRRNMPGGVGWALYGFESVIWARKRAGP